MSTVDTFYVSGTWTAPAGVTSLDVACYGPGSGGIGGSPAGGANSGGFGGGGGAYAHSVVTVVPGQTYSFTVGRGGDGGSAGNYGAAGSGPTSWNGGQVSADYGRAFSSGSGFCPGGTQANSVGTNTRNGGHGGTATGSGGGGGGGCGGVGAGGGAGGGSTSGTGAAGGAGAGSGGDGGAGGNSGAAGQEGGSPGGGGGGGGGGSSSAHGAAGGSGILVLTYSAPAVTTTSLAAGYVGTAYSQTLAATGGNGSDSWSVISGSLPAGLSLNSSGTISGTPTTAATSSFTVQVTDSTGDYGTAALSITIDAALSVTTTSVAHGYQGAAYSVQLAATGGSGTGYAWSVSSGSLPAGVSLSSTGSLAGTPTASGTFTFTAEVTDSASNTATQSLSLLVYPTVSITTASVPNGQVALAYTSTTLAATGGTGTGYTWSLATGSSLPPGLSLSSGGVLTGTPTSAGSYSFTVQVVDSGGYSATKVFSITVISVAVGISPSSLSYATTGVAFSQTFTGSGGTSPYSFAVTSGSLPPGLSFSSAVLSGTPTTTGTYTFTITASDSAGHSTAYSFTLAVYNPLADTTSTPLPYGLTGTAYSETFAYTGGDGVNTWSVTSGSLPGGLTLSSAGVLSGTPTATGSFSFTVTVADTAGHSTGKPFTMPVYAPVVVGTSSLPNGYQTVAYSQTLTASGGSGSGYTWSLYTGSLPPGLSMSSSGVITGTPLLAESASFTVLVTDSVGITATKALSITTNPPLAITTTSLPTGYETVAYSTTLASTGGSGTGLAWTITSGSLPSPLTLSSGGVISGTPPTGTYPTTTSITVKVTDSAGNTATQALTLKLNPLPPVITSTAMGSGEVGQYYTNTLAATSGVPPYSWGVSSGTLPPGLILLSGSGTVTGSPETTGEWYVTFEVTDSVSSLSAPVTLSISIEQQLDGLPATYGDVDYGTVVYGEVAFPARQQTVLNNFVIEPFTAVSLNYGSIGVAWTKPLAAVNGAAVRWRLISNRYGYPVDQNDGNIILDTPKWFGTFYLDSAVIPGTYHYYGIYAQTNATADTWVRVGVTGCLATENAGKAQWLLSHLPAYFTDYLNSPLTQDAAGNAYLGQFLSVLGWGLDYAQGQYDMQYQHQNDPMAIPIDDLVNLAAQMGMPYDPFISIYLMRKAVANWAHVATERGTTQGIANQIDLLTGWDVDLQLSPNQLLEDDQSWFPHPAYQAWNGYTTYKAGEIVSWQSGASAWVYQSIAGGNGGNTPSAGASNAYWTLMKNVGDPAGTLANATTGYVNTWEVIYPAQTNGTGPVSSLVEAIGCPSPANASLFLSNTLKLTNLEATSQDMYIRSVSRSITDRNTTTTSPFAADQTQAVNDGIPVPFTLPDAAWNSTTRYGTGDIVTYQAQPFIALRASTGATPVPGRTSTREWQPLSTDERIRLMLDAQVEGSSAVAMTPFVEWYDQWGNFITRVTARTPTAGTPGIPNQLAFDSFGLNPGASVSGRSFDNSYAYNWTAAANDFTVSQWQGGVAYPNTLGSRSVALTTGPANGQVGVTICTFPPNQAAGMGIVFRYSNSTNYWAVEAYATGYVALFKNVAGTTTVVTGTANGVANPGDRLVVQMNGTTMTVLLNGTQILTYTDGTSFNTTATQHGIIVE